MQPSRLGCHILRNVPRRHTVRTSLNASPRLISKRWLSSSPWFHAKDFDDNVDVRWFEQDIGGDPRKRRRVSPEEVRRRDEEAHASAEEYEESMEEFKDSDPFAQAMDLVGDLDEEGNEDLESLTGTLFSNEELDQMRKLAPSKEQLAPNRVVIESVIPRQSQLFLNNFNDAIDMVVAHPKADARKQELWRWYSRCKVEVPHFLSSIPKAAWHTLWHSQGEDVASNPQRLSKLRQIAEDKRSAGWTLSTEERMAQIEALFLDGQRQSAFDQYDYLVTSENSENKQLMEMGIRMYGHDGQAEKALDILKRAFEADQQTNPRLLINVIKSFISRQNEASSLRAYELYQDLSQRLSSDMVMRDYDVVSLEFLAAGQATFALAVFRDMMLQGDSSKQGRGFLKGSQAMSRLAEFVGIGTAQQATKVSREAIRYLPRRYQNKYFYASWLKKLLGEGEIESAWRVVDLMYERGANPDAKHVNGIVASLIRSPEKEAKEKGESIAWAMIQRRLNFTADRRDGLLSDEHVEPGRKLVKNSSEGLDLPERTSRSVPAASIETFSILLQYYARRSKFDHVRRLRDLLVDAEIPMNSFFMNHILYAELRSRGYGYAFARFDVLSKAVRPDLETYLCLWQCMKQLVHDKRNQVRRDFSAFPTHRQLYKQMLQWLSKLTGQPRTAALGDMNPDTYHAILRTFATAHDLKGMFVAMHSLRHTFNIRPNQETVQMLQQMVAAIEPVSRNKLPVQRTRHMRRAKLPKKGETRQNRDMQNASVIINTVRNSRVERYLADEVDLEAVDPEDAVEESYRACLEVLWTFTRRHEGDGAGQAKRIIDVAHEMGIDGLDPEAEMELLDL